MDVPILKLVGYISIREGLVNEQIEDGVYMLYFDKKGLERDYIGINDNGYIGSITVVNQKVVSVSAKNYNKKALHRVFAVKIADTPD